MNSKLQPLFKCKSHSLGKKKRKARSNATICTTRQDIQEESKQQHAAPEGLEAALPCRDRGARTTQTLQLLDYQSQHQQGFDDPHSFAMSIWLSLQCVQLYNVYIPRVSFTLCSSYNT